MAPSEDTNNARETSTADPVESEFQATDQQEDEPFDVDNFVAMFYEPTYSQITETLNKLKVKPAFWGSRLANRPQSEQERKKCARYLTSIISSELPWLESNEQRENLWQLASRCLAQRCGRTGAPAMTRTWKLWDDVSVVIHEPPLTGDNLGLKTWCSSYVLAKRLDLIHVEHPLQIDEERIIQVLELGSGTGLVGLAAAALWKCCVLLTDLPEIVTNLKRNAELNRKMITDRGGDVKVEVLDWDNLPHITFTRGLCQFVIAADPLYSPEHAPLLAKAIDVYLKKDKEARVIIELPYRDKATRDMAKNLREILDGLQFNLLQQGEETAYDDWENSNGQAATVKCWWGIWGRRCPVPDIEFS